jgi:Family of unknown function (DUF5681)
MTFQKGHSGNPAGRPPGARNRATMLAEELLDGEVEAITRTAIERAKDGDSIALRLCLDRLVPPRKQRTITFDLPPLATAPDAAGAIAAIAAAVAGGELTPGEAADLMQVVDGYARTLELATFEIRLAKLEREAAEIPVDAAHEP